VTEMDGARRLWCIDDSSWNFMSGVLVQRNYAGHIAPIRNSEKPNREGGVDEIGRYWNSERFGAVDFIEGWNETNKPVGGLRG
jgi:hypothetical protein